MYRYNPTECQPCPKCGVDIDVLHLKKVYIDIRFTTTPYIKIECTCCGYELRRRPLDSEGDD